jgi:hypothetical protein
MISPSSSAVVEHALEIVIRRDLARVGDDRRARGQRRRRVAGGRVVVGEEPPMVPRLRTAGSPILPASAASAG